MSSLYAVCLVVGAGVTLLSAVGEFLGRGFRLAGRSGAVFSVRSAMYSLAGFGACGLILGRLDPGLGGGLRFGFSVLAGLLVGGLTATGLAFLRRDVSRGRDEQG